MSQIATFSVKDIEQTGILGNAFGVTLLRPLVEEDRRAFTVPVYGPKDSGKTTLLRQAVKPFGTEANPEVFRWTILRKGMAEPPYDPEETCVVKGNQLRFYDLGCQTHVCGYRSYDEHKATDNMFRTWTTPRASLPGFDLAEHASAPYVEDAPVVMCLASPQSFRWFTPYDASAYMNYISESLRDANTASSRSVAQQVESMKKLSEELCYTPQASERLISINFLKPNEIGRGRIDAFMDRAKDFLRHARP